MKIIPKIIAVSLFVIPQTVFAQETISEATDLQLLRHCETLARGEQSENRSSANLIDELGLCFTYIKEISALRKEFSEIGSFDFNQAGLNDSDNTLDEGSDDTPQSRKFLNPEEVQNMIRESIEALHDELLLEESIRESSLDELQLDEEVELEGVLTNPSVSNVDLAAAYVGKIRQDNMDKHIVVVTGQFLTLSEGDRVANQVFEKRLDGFYLGGDKLVDYVLPSAETDEAELEEVLNS